MRSEDTHYYISKNIVSFGAQKIKCCAIFALIFRKDDAIWQKEGRE